MSLGAPFAVFASGVFDSSGQTGNTRNVPAAFVRISFLESNQKTSRLSPSLKNYGTVFSGGASKVVSGKRGQKNER